MRGKRTKRTPPRRGGKRPKPHCTLMGAYEIAGPGINDDGEPVVVVSLTVLDLRESARLSRWLSSKLVRAWLTRHAPRPEQSDE